jgi:uncharacterized protein (DUF779 family)
MSGIGRKPRDGVGQGSWRVSARRISATAAARKAIRRLRATRGQDLMFVQSAGCCAGSMPMCFPAGEFIVGDGDLLLGVIEGCPFYMDARIYRSWGRRADPRRHPGRSRGVLARPGRRDALRDQGWHVRA